MSELEAGREIDLLITEMMETKPATITAQSLRERERMTEWYSTHYGYSPDGWWRAEIGTNHNLDERNTYRAERDYEPVVWEPAKEPSSDIADAWEVVEKMRNPGFRLNKEGDWGCTFGGDHRFCAFADTAPLAICRAALLAEWMRDERE